MSDAKSNGSQLAVPHVLLLITLASVFHPLELYRNDRAQAIYVIIYLLVVVCFNFPPMAALFLSYLVAYLAFWGL